LRERGFQREEVNISVTIDRESLFRGRVYRVTGEPVVANTETNSTAARELHIATCRRIKKYSPDGPELVALTEDEVDEAWIRAVEEDTATDSLATEWPLSAETAWCPSCIVKVLARDDKGNYKHPRARSPKWRPGIPLACRFPNVHDERGLCGCKVD
jgi:hypothetical protein